jgi:hypothetical protein
VRGLGNWTLLLGDEGMKPNGLPEVSASRGAQRGSSGVKHQAIGLSSRSGFALGAMWRSSFANGASASGSGLGWSPQMAT